MAAHLLDVGCRHDHESTANIEDVASLTCLFVELVRTAYGAQNAPAIAALTIVFTDFTDDFAHGFNIWN